MTKRIVINTRNGGFSLNKQARARLMELAPELDTIMAPYDTPRDHPALVQLVEEIEAGQYSQDYYSKLEIVEIPDDIEWTIEDRNGSEWVAERHRTWTL